MVKKIFDGICETVATILVFIVAGIVYYFWLGGM